MTDREQGGRAGEILVRPLDAALGAEVVCADVANLGPAARAALHQAYLDHLVLIVRGQRLSDEALVETARIFGAPADTTYGGGESVMVAEISNVGERRFLGDGELSWHTDHSFSDRPLSASLLHAIEVPPKGGDTYWSNMYLAWEALPAELKLCVCGRTIRQDTTSNSAGERVATADAEQRPPGPSHPVVRTHPETGQNALYLGRRSMARVDGMSATDSEELLDLLWTHASDWRFVYRHHWTAGDLIVWDNRAVMHRRDAFDGGERRVMRRAQCSGGITRYDPAAEARGHHRVAALGWCADAAASLSGSLDAAG